MEVLEILINTTFIGETSKERAVCSLVSEYNVSNVWTIARQIEGILKSKGWLVCSSSVIVATTSLVF